MRLSVSTSTKSKLESMANITHPSPSRETWKQNHILSFNVYLSLLCVAMVTRENEASDASAHTVFTEYINDDDTKIDGGLAFDASFFKANRKVQWRNNKPFLVVNQFLKHKSSVYYFVL